MQMRKYSRNPIIIFPMQSSQLGGSFQNILQDQANLRLIKEMEEEMSIWIIRICFLFVFILQLYVNLDYNIPLALLFGPLTLLDCFMVWYNLKNSRQSM